MSTIDPLLNQLKYANRQRVKDDIHKVTLEYRTLAPKIVDYGTTTESTVIAFTNSVTFILILPPLVQCTTMEIKQS
jgi:hypothetical protein